MAKEEKIKQVNPAKNPKELNFEKEAAKTEIEESTRLKKPYPAADGVPTYIPATFREQFALRDDGLLFLYINNIWVQIN